MSTRRAANQHSLSKSQTYACGVFTVSTDLRAIIELFGLEKTIDLAKALDLDLRKRRAKQANNRNKIQTHQQRVVAKATLKLSDHVQRALAQHIALKKTPKKVA